MTEEEIKTLKLYATITHTLDKYVWLREDEKGKMLNPKEVVENAPRHSGNYIAVPVVISNGEGA